MEGSLSQHEVYMEKPLLRININDFVHRDIDQLFLAGDQFNYNLLTG